MKTSPFRELPEWTGETTPNPLHRENCNSSTDEGGAAPAALSPSVIIHPLQSSQIGEMKTSPFRDLLKLTEEPFTEQMESFQLNILQINQCARQAMDLMNSTAQPTQQEPSRWLFRAICLRTHLTRERTMSRATQQTSLLRRCFFPRRDVIRWLMELPMRLPCEVSNSVQGPLTKLCRRVWRGVDLTCVRTIRNNMRDMLERRHRDNCVLPVVVSALLLQMILPWSRLRYNTLPYRKQFRQRHRISRLLPKRVLATVD